jgi:hypothetical protein
MKNSIQFNLTNRCSKSSFGNLFGALFLVSAVVLPSLASAATISFSLTWTNSKKSTDTFSGTLKVDSELLPSSGVADLTKASATLSVAIPQLGNTTYTMADLAKFDIGLSQLLASKLSAGQDLLRPDLVGKAIIFGKIGSPAHKNFNQCSSEYGVCFNREGQPPVYNLTSMKVLSVTP